MSDQPAELEHLAEEILVAVRYLEREDGADPELGKGYVRHVHQLLDMAFTQAEQLANLETELRETVALHKRVLSVIQGHLDAAEPQDFMVFVEGVLAIATEDEEPEEEQD